MLGGGGRRGAKCRSMVFIRFAGARGALGLPGFGELGFEKISRALGFLEEIHSVRAT